MIKDGPREKLEKYGVSVLKDEELLAILLKTGSKKEDVISLSKRVLEECISLKNLLDYSYHDLMVFDGIGKCKAMTIISSLELSRRLLIKDNKRKLIRCPKDIYNLIKDDYINLTIERFSIIYLDTNYSVIYIKTIDGTFNKVIFDDRDIIKKAIKLNAISICLCHNHPGGNINPSIEDLESTEMLESKLIYLGIELFDHIIISNDEYYSIKYSK